MSLDTSFSEQQLRCLCLLADGEWRDRQEIRERLGLKLIPSNVYNRIILPLEKRGLIEQDVQPLSDKSRKKKKIARMIEGQDGADRLYILRSLSNGCETLHDHYAALYQNATEKQKPDEILSDLMGKRDLYSDMCKRFDECYNYFNNIYSKGLNCSDDKISTTYEWSPAMGKLMKLTEIIKPYCKSDFDARLATYKLDQELQLGLLKSHREWQLSNGQRCSVLSDIEKAVSSPMQPE